MNLSKLLKSNILLIWISCFSILNAQVVFTQQEQNWINKNPIVTVGGGPDWAPIDFVEDDRYKGIANDYLDIISQKTGLTFDIHIDKWKNNLSKMKHHQIDLLPAVKLFSNA